MGEAEAIGLAQAITEDEAMACMRSPEAGV